MADAVLSVEVRARLEKLSSGLKHGEKNIGDFVAAGDRNLSKIEARFESLGKTTKDIANNIKSALGGISIDEYMKGFGDSKATIERSRSEIQKYKEEIERLKQVGQDLTNQIKEKTKALNDSKLATEQSKQATEAQRKATEAERTATAAVRKEITQLTLDKKKNAQETKVATGSYREAQQRLTALGKAIRETGGGFDATNPKIKAQITEYNNLNNKLKEFDKLMGNHQRNVGNYGSAFAGAMPYLGQFTSAAGIASMAAAGITKSFETNLKLDALNVALKETSGSSENFRQNVDFLRVTANRLGLDLVTTTGAFKQWQGAAKFSNMTMDETRSIFESVANAGAKLKLSNDQVQGTFLALSQMLSKGKVQAEELRGQLGERLPGAFALAAKAMGVTEKELNKMLESGEVIADEFLPKFAKQLDESFSNDKSQRIESLQASVNRLSTEWDLLFKSEVATAFYGVMIDGLAGLLKGVSGNTDASRDLRAEYSRVQEQFESTYRNATYLTQEYDNLKAKTELNKDEQQRLKDVIQKIADLMPSAVSEWGKYGNALDINRDKVKGMTGDLIELRRLQSKGITDELSGQFDKSQRAVSGWNDQIRIIQKRMNAFGPSYKGRLKDEQAILKIQEKIKLEQGESFAIAEKLKGIGTISLTGDQKDVIAHYRGVESAAGATSKAIIKNKEYWDAALKSLKKEFESLDNSDKGSKKWKDLSAQIKEAKANVDAYSVSKQLQEDKSTAKAAIKDEKESQRIRERGLKEYESAYNKLNKVIIDSSNSLTKAELTGFAKVQEGISQKYESWRRSLNEVASDTVKSQSMTASQRLEIETSVNQSILELEKRRNQESMIAATSMMQKVLKEREESYKKTNKKIAEETSKIKIDAVEIDLVFSRRTDETSSQKAMKELNAKYKKMSEDLKKNLQSQIAIGVTVDADNRELMLQKDLYRDMEGIHRKDQMMRLAMVDSRNLFNKALEESNILLEENARKLQAGTITEEQYKKTQSTLLDTQDQLNMLNTAFGNLTSGVGNAFSAMLTEGQSFGEGMQSVFKSMVSGIISEMMRLAAIKLFGLLLAPLTGGASAAITTVLTGAIVEKGFASGGYTGNGGTSDVAGVVHGKEFVFDAQSTKRLGVGNLEALQSGRIPSVSDFTPRITKNNSNFIPSIGSNGNQHISLDVNVDGGIRNNTIKVAGIRATRVEKIFGRG